MLAKGDLKFRLNGKRLKGDFALVKMRARRPGSKGNEWLMIKKHDDHVVEGYDIDAIDESVLTGRTLEEVAGDAGSAEWKSRPAGRGKLKAAWLADAVAKLDKRKKKQLTTGDTEDAEKNRKRKNVSSKKLSQSETAAPQKKETKTSASSASSAVQAFAGTTKRPMPLAIHPMLAESVDKPFDGAEWLFEIKWDGYRAVAFIDGR